jgi:(E)-4-hydroxy-3-methylbut-2-enyl-diphosphate synthase
MAMLDHIITACDRAAYWQVLFGLRMPAGVPGSLGGIRQACTVLAAKACQAPVVLEYGVPSGAEHWQLDAAATLGALLCEGLGNGVLIDGAVTAEEALRFSYGVLQATRRRISQAEFISCPSCGRTQFDLQATTACIKAQTRHLTGVKIAIMGCIVNGPGEMADADFGYVGAGPGTVNLFVGKACVARHIPEALAAPRLIDLIKRHGKWVEP